MYNGCGLEDMRMIVGLEDLDVRCNVGSFRSALSLNRTYALR